MDASQFWLKLQRRVPGDPGQLKEKRLPRMFLLGALRSIRLRQSLTTTPRQSRIAARLDDVADHASHCSRPCKVVIADWLE